MTAVKVRNITIGEGMPKICVPIVATDDESILSAARVIAESEKDLVEWRMDWYRDVKEIHKVIKMLGDLREILGEAPILATLRTKDEGGEIAVSEEEYNALYEAIIEKKAADLIDLEMMHFPESTEKLAKAARANAVAVVGSNHDFVGTPAKEELVRRMCRMQEMGADLPKLAVMPQKEEDVLTLLAATLEMKKMHDDTPVITMSMSKFGLVSRMSGEIFGAALTFGAVGKASAPGQIPSEKLREILELLH